MYKKRQLQNGFSTVVSHMPQMSSVSLGIWIGVGGRYEKEKQSGISHVIEHMLFKGTESRTAKGLKETIEGVGGSFNGFTSDEVTCYMVKVPATYMELGMDILSDMVLNPRFDENDFAREKSVICEEIKMYRDQPADHVMELLEEIMWPGNPLGRPLTGKISTVKKFNPKEILKFKEESYHPGNIAVIAAGKVLPEKLFKYTSRRFSGMNKKKWPAFKSVKSGQKRPRTKFLKSETQQTHITLGFHAQDDSVRERFAFKMMNVMLGGNMSSRLFEELREKYGLCYDISSMYKRHSDVGEVVIHSGVDNRNALKSVIAVLDELRKIRDLGVTEAELTRAKEYTKGQFLLAMEGTSSRMLWLGDRFMVHKRIPEVKYVLDKVDEIGISDIKKVCGKIFTPASVNLALIGNMSEKDKNKIKKELNRL